MNSRDYKFSLFCILDIESRTRSINSLDSINGLTMSVPVTSDGTISWFHRIASDNMRRDFVLRDGHETVGFSGLVSINHINGYAELYIFMVPGFYRQGHGRELLQLTLSYAKHELNLRKITLFVNGANESAIKLYERAGFKKEGVLEKHSWHRGRYVDRYIYSLFLDSVDVSPVSLYGIMQ